MYIYTDETAGNTLFEFADTGAAFIMSNHVKPGDFTGGLDEVTEAVGLARSLVAFSTVCLAVMISTGSALRTIRWIFPRPPS
jgi:hypothetical protein